MVEFALVFYIYIAVLFVFIIHASWLYNSFQADRAARHGAVYLGTTNNYAKAKTVAENYLAKTQIFSRTKNVSVYWNGNSPACRVETSMKTFFPGIPKILNKNNPIWSKEVQIIKEVAAPGENRYINPSEYNWR
ncbi:hypothetical protein [Desulforamulus profundi]|uniref:hypothetical protein n=1 Tax=Desulforamulus profundi TaxID=1383067 RepID=UPI0030830A08